MTSPRREYWDLVADDWSQNHPQALWRRHADWVNSRILTQWLPQRQVGSMLKTDLFDEAVSQGLYPLLAEQTRQFVGMDVSQGIVDAACNRYAGLEAHIADVRRLPFPDGSFDMVISFSTLDHFESRADIQAALNECARVLHPGGQMILTLDNLSNPVIWLRSVLPQKLLLGLGLIPYRVGMTCRHGRLESFCRNAGFEVRATRAIMHCPRVAAVAIARLLEQHTSARTQSRFLACLESFERLGRWRSRFFTGHFTAILACKPR